MVVFTSSVQHAWILKRTRNCMFVPFFMQSTVKKPCITWRKSEGYENQQTTGVLIAIHMIWPYLFDGLKCIQFDTNNGDLLKTLHVNGFIGVSILCATHRFIAPNTHVHCTQNMNENKSHNYICPLGKWYRFPIQKTPCKFNCIDKHTHTKERISFHDLIVCGIIMIGKTSAFAEYYIFGLADWVISHWVFFVGEHIRVFWITFERGTNNTKPG